MVIACSLVLRWTESWKVDTMVLTFSDSPKDPSVKQERTSDSSGKYNFETTL